MPLSVTWWWARVLAMRTLHVGLRVSDLERSLAFYCAVGYTVAGTVQGTALGTLAMLRLPGDDYVTIELVHDPARGTDGTDGTGLSHLVIQVESLDATLAGLAAKGIAAEPPGSLAARTGCGPAGSPTPTATGSSWSSGQPATRRHDQGRLRLSRVRARAGSPRAWVRA